MRVSVMEETIVVDVSVDLSGFSLLFFFFFGFKRKDERETEDQRANNPPEWSAVAYSVRSGEAANAA